MQSQLQPFIKALHGAAGLALFQHYFLDVNTAVCCWCIHLNCKAHSLS